MAELERVPARTGVDKVAGLHCVIVQFVGAARRFCRFDHVKHILRQSIGGHSLQRQLDGGHAVVRDNARRYIVDLSADFLERGLYRPARHALERRNADPARALGGFYSIDIPHKVCLQLFERGLHGVCVHAVKWRHADVFRAVLLYLSAVVLKVLLDTLQLLLHRAAGHVGKCIGADLSGAVCGLQALDQLVKPLDNKQRQQIENLLVFLGRAGQRVRLALHAGLCRLFG